MTMNFYEQLKAKAIGNSMAKDQPLTYYELLKAAALTESQKQPTRRYIYVGTDGKTYLGTDGKVYVSKKKGA